MFQTRQIARAIYDEDYTKAVTMLLSIVEEQQKEIKELKNQVKDLNERAVVKL